MNYIFGFISGVASVFIGVFIFAAVRVFRGGVKKEEKKKFTEEEGILREAHKDLDANKLMHEYEKEVFGWWGGDKVKADAMTAQEIQEKWKAHQKKLRDLGDKIKKGGESNMIRCSVSEVVKCPKINAKVELTKCKKCPYFFGYCENKKFYPRYTGYINCSNDDAFYKVEKERLGFKIKKKRRIG